MLVAAARRFGSSRIGQYELSVIDPPEAQEAVGAAGVGAAAAFCMTGAGAAVAWPERRAAAAIGSDSAMSCARRSSRAAARSECFLRCNQTT